MLCAALNPQRLSGFLLAFNVFIVRKLEKCSEKIPVILFLCAVIIIVVVWTSLISWNQSDYTTL